MQDWTHIAGLLSVRSVNLEIKEGSDHLGRSTSKTNLICADF
jgi:hypothetical protein